MGVIKNLSKEVKISDALDHAEGSADRNGNTLDMSGYDGVMTVVKFGDIAAGSTAGIKMQMAETTNFSTAIDMQGSHIAVAANDDNQIFVSDIYRPEHRYVRLNLNKDGANNTEEMAFYVQYNARSRPQSNNVTDEVTSEFHVSPSSGTA